MNDANKMSGAKILSLYHHGDRVMIDRGFPSERTGAVIGKCLVKRILSSKAVTLYAVELDGGYYDETKVSYTSVTLAHPDSLTRIEP